VCSEKPAVLEAGGKAVHFIADDSCSVNNGLQELTRGHDERGRRTESQLHRAITGNIVSSPAEMPLTRMSAQSGSHSCARCTSSEEKMKVPLRDGLPFSPRESSLFRHCDTFPVFV
jgi:hypothetical protein